MSVRQNSASDSLFLKMKYLSSRNSSYDIIIVLPLNCSHLFSLSKYYNSMTFFSKVIHIKLILWAILWQAISANKDQSKIAINAISTWWMLFLCILLVAFTLISKLLTYIYSNNRKINFYNFTQFHHLTAAIFKTKHLSINATSQSTGI